MSGLLWLVLAAMAALALAFVLPPLLGWRRRDEAPRAAYDAEIYRDQLAEIEREMERGVLNADQAEAARAEIGRRLLATGAEDSAVDTAGSGPGGFRIAATTVGVLVPLVAVLLYLRLGAPELAVPGRASPQQEAEQAAPGDRETATLVEELGRRLKTRPDDARGWSLYARSLAGLRRFEDANAAFRRATALAPDDTDLLSRMAEAQIFAAGGTVTPEARQTLDRVAAMEPDEPRALYYLGLAERQAGRSRQALERWLRLEAASPPGAPWRKLLAGRIAALAQELGIDDAAVTALRKNAVRRAAQGGPGPTAADVRAAGRMSAGERGAMIRTMVKRLADRLAGDPEDPDHLEDWHKLARSYGILGEAAKAQQALARADAARQTIFAEGARAYDAGDYDTAFENWHRLAQGGDARAQTAIAGMFRSGNGRPASLEKAAIWYGRAADQGEPVAQMNLGEMYIRGLGVRRDRVRAYVLFTLAAAQGKTWAATELGKLAPTMTADELAGAARLLRESGIKSPIK